MTIEDDEPADTPPKLSRLLRRTADLVGRASRRFRVALLSITTFVLVLALIFLPRLLSMEALETATGNLRLSESPSRTVQDISSFLDQNPIRRLEELGDFVDRTFEAGRDPLQAELPQRIKFSLCEGAGEITAFGVRTDCLDHNGNHVKKRDTDGRCLVRYYREVRIWDIEANKSVNICAPEPNDAPNEGGQEEEPDEVGAAESSTEPPGWVEDASKRPLDTLVVSRLDGNWISKKESGLTTVVKKTPRGQLKAFGPHMEGISKITTVEHNLPSPLYRGFYHFALGTSTTISSERQPLEPTPRFVVSLDLDHSHIEQFAKKGIIRKTEIFDDGSEVDKFLTRTAKTAKEHLAYYYYGGYMYLADDRSWILAHPKPWHIIGKDANGEWPESMNAFIEDGSREGGERLEGEYPLNLFQARTLDKMRPYYERVTDAICTQSFVPLNKGESLENVSRMVGFYPIRMHSGKFYWHELDPRDTTTKEIKSLCYSRGGDDPDSGGDDPDSRGNIFGLLVAGHGISTLSPNMREMESIAPYLATSIGVFLLLNILLVTPEFFALVKCATASAHLDEKPLLDLLNHSLLLAAASKTSRRDAMLLVERIRMARQQDKEIDLARAWMHDLPPLVGSALEPRAQVHEALGQLRRYHCDLAHLAIDFDDAAESDKRFVLVRQEAKDEWLRLLGVDSPTIYYYDDRSIRNGAATLEYNTSRGCYILSNLGLVEASLTTERIQTIPLKLRGRQHHRDDLELRIAAVFVPDASRFWRLSIRPKGTGDHASRNSLSDDYERLVWQVVSKGTRLSLRMQTSGQDMLRHAFVPYVEEIASDLHMVELLAKLADSSLTEPDDRNQDRLLAALRNTAVIIEEISKHTRATKPSVNVLLNARFSKASAVDIASVIEGTIRAKNWEAYVEFHVTQNDRLRYHISKSTVESIVTTTVERAIDRSGAARKGARGLVVLQLLRDGSNVVIQCDYRGRADRIDKDNEGRDLDFIVRLNGGTMSVEREKPSETNSIIIRLPLSNIEDG